MNNNTTTPVLSFSRVDEIIQMSVTLPCVVIGLVGNLLVIAVILFKRRMKKTNNDIFLLNLAISDLLYICLNTGNFVYNLSYFVPHFKSLLFCRTFFPMLSVPYCSGVFTIAGMSIYRCLVIMNPFKPKTRPIWIHLCALITWVLAISVVLPFVILSVNAGPQCIFPGWTDKDYKLYFCTVTIVQYPLPLLVILLAYLKIGIYLRKPRVPQLSFVARGNTLVSPRDETRKESLAMTKTVGAIVLLFAVLMLPLQIAMHAVISFGVHEPWTSTLWSYGDRLAMIHSALNPFLYTIRTPQYRQQIMYWIKRKPLNNQGFSCQRTRCQSFTPSCATTEVELNERKCEEQAVIKHENNDRFDVRL